MRRALLALILLAPACGRGSSSVSYKDARQPVDARVADLLARMTLEEKVAQTLAHLEGQGEDHGREGAVRPRAARAR